MATTSSATETVQLRRRHTPPKRRFSVVHTGTYTTRSLCESLPHSLEALDLSYASITPTLASLRHQILCYLADLEARLTLLESPISSDALKLKGELTVEEARVWARDGLELLQSIRADVCSHLPEFSLEQVPTVESLKSRIPDVPRLEGVRAHLPDMPDAVRCRLPDFDLSDMRARLDDVRSRISDIDFHRPLTYIPTLSQHLQTLQMHLSSMELPHSFNFSSLTPGATISDLLDKVISSDIISEISSDIREGEDKFEKAAVEMARAMKRSLNGSRLIHYVDLPEKWRNNPFVQRGYRFIPLHDWPRLLLSLFALHNETLNIHTHLIPFIALLSTIVPLSPYFVSSAVETPVYAFTAFALVCLFTSSLWHTMAGCAHEQGMELCARIDYVGIGWLISASVGTVVYYGFQCHPKTCNAFLSLCFIMGISGSILPFMGWFNRPESRAYRITFFVALALVSIAPLAVLSQMFSLEQTVAFVYPISPSFVSYIVGLLFYATHFPERFLAKRWSHSHLLDYLGGGSHAIWHVFIVLAISQHKSGMAELRNGIGEMCW